jgi:hypothetical protein
MQSEKTKTLLAEIAKSKAEMTKIKEEMSIKIQENFHGMAKELFLAYPELKSFGWRQYTPYFNDGEACEFRSNHDSPIINGVDVDYDDNEPDDDAINIVKGCEEKDWRGNINPDFNPYYKEIVDTLKEFLNQFDDDDMYDLFDDHVIVNITADGFTTEEYNHD